MQWKTNRRSCCRGVTLIEFLAVMAVLAILLGISLPSMRLWIDGVRVGALARGLLTDLQLTRSEAIRQGERVVLCAASSPDACAQQPGWHQGWLMFVDRNNNARRDDGETVLRYHGPAPSGWTVRGNRPVAGFVSYDQLGATRLVSGAFQAGSILLCPDGLSSRSLHARRIVISSAGRPRSELANDPQACD